MQLKHPPQESVNTPSTVSYHHDRPSGHYYRERRRREAQRGLVRVCDLVDDATRDLLRKIEVGR